MFLKHIACVNFTATVMVLVYFHCNNKYFSDLSCFNIASCFLCLGI